MTSLGLRVWGLGFRAKTSWDPVVVLLPGVPHITRF